MIWAALIFFLSHQPDLPSPPFAFPGLDKIVHAGSYALLAILLVLADAEPRRAWWWAVLTALYGISDEVHQAFVPGRRADVADFAADASGATLAIAVWMKGKRGTR